MTEAEERLAGGSNDGAVLVEGSVRRRTGDETPAVHALLRHLESMGFDGAPRVLGIDDLGRESLTYLPGDTIGDRRPWPAWARSGEALLGAARWMRRYHDAVRSFVPPPDAAWFGDHRELRPGEIVTHNDAGPYNAVWDASSSRVSGFIDWSLATPAPPVRDLAFLAITWVPLLPDAVARADGLPLPIDRAARLRMAVDAYGWAGDRAEVLEAVVARADDHAAGLIAAAAAGYRPAAALVDAGVARAFARVRSVVACVV